MKFKFIKDKKTLIPFPAFFLFVVASQLCPSIIVTNDIEETKQKLEVVADNVLKDATFQFVNEQNGQLYDTLVQAPQNAALRIKSRYNDWRYWNGVLNIALIKLGNILDKKEYVEFPVKNMAFNFGNYKYFQGQYKDEDKWSYPFAQHFIMEELDDYGAMGASLIEVYQQGPQERYRAYLDKAAKYLLLNQNRLPDSTLVRAFPVKWTIWADDLYMSVSFLSRMGKLTGDIRYLEFAATQVINFNKYLFDANKGLMYHCWYSNTKENGVAFWGRTNGWALLAQIDLLDRLPDNFSKRNKLLELFRRQVKGVVQYQSNSGLWHQLLDKNDSYLETSCSAMFTYVIARAIDEGYLSKDYTSIALKGWEGVESKIRTDGQIEGVCTGTGVGDNLSFYYNRPAPLNDVHGIGAVLLAGSEILQLSK